MERGNIIAVAGSLVALLIGTVFVFFYTAMKIKIFKAISGGTLPGACLLFHSLTLPALFVPAGFGAVLPY